MNPSTLQQTIGNICVGLATLLFLLPLQNLLSDWARKETSSNQWVTPILVILIPVWLLLMAALICVTASAGFDWLPLSRPMLYAFTVAAAIALGVVTFVFVGLYLRPGFTPRVLYSPVIYLIHFSTVLLVVLSLNPKLAFGISMQWLRWPWTVFATLSLVISAAFCGYWLFRAGTGGIRSIAFRIANAGPSQQERISKISTLDPQANFSDLLWQANRNASREICEAATARLRSHPKFLETLAAELEGGHVEPAVTFLRDATLTPIELTRLARPARKAMERWVDRIPAPNYTTKKHLKDLRRWGTEMFRVLPEKFANAGVDFAPVMADFKDKVEATR